MLPPNVLHIVWNLIRGGTEGQCARVAMALVARGGKHRVAVFRREGFFLDDVERVCGPVYPLDIRRLIRPRTLWEVMRLSGYIEREDIQIVHAWDADAAVFGQFAAQWSGARLITSRRDLGQIYPSWKLAMMRRADRVARAVVVNAEAIRERLLAQGVPAAKIRTIPNLINLAEFDELAARDTGWEGRLPGCRRVVMVSRLDPEKDAETFVRAAARVAVALPDVSFVLAGDGPELPALRLLAAQLGIERRVMFLGDVKDVPSLLTCCQIGALLPKANEGLSNSILEYMAARLPVVASDCGGNRELVRDGVTGFIVPVGNADAAAHALIDLLDKPELARSMGVQGRQRVSQEHGADVVADRFAALYEKVCM